MSAAYIGFTYGDIDLINRFFRFMNIVMWDELKVETNNNESDTLNLGAYSIIKGEDGKFQLDRLSTAYSWQHGPEQTERLVGNYFNLVLALIGMAQDYTAELAGAFFESEAPYMG